MYNRYIPQPDGSYRRNRIPEPQPPPRRPPSRPQHQDAPPPPQPQPKPAPVKPSPPPCNKPEQGIGSFFRQLLPANLDTADLLVVVLLLLMAGDNEEGHTNALLTLALYFLL